MTTVAVLGLGAMGSGLAGNLAAAGHPVTVWNRTRAKADALAAVAGVRVADSPAAAATTADVVLACVADDAASADVWLDPTGGALAALPPGAVAVEASTLSPAWIGRLGAEAEARGSRFLEAPVIGSRPQLAARQLVHVCGGASSVLDGVREVLAVSAARVEHVGPLGAAATIKLVVNGLLAVQAAAGAELLAVLAGSSVDPDAAIELLAGLPTTSPALVRLLGLMRHKTFAPNFPIRLVAKDLGYLADMAGPHAPVLAAVRARFRAAEAAGRGELDIAGIYP